MKDKVTRESKGVAFVLYVDRAAAYKSVQAMNRKELFGRRLRCSIAKDNGRASEFIKRRYYKDKSRCYECGEYGHLSYKCPKNALGDRERPVKKKRKKKEGEGKDGDAQDVQSDEEEEELDDDLTLREAIRLELTFQSYNLVSCPLPAQLAISTMCFGWIGMLVADCNIATGITGQNLPLVLKIVTCTAQLRVDISR